MHTRRNFIAGSAAIAGSLAVAGLAAQAQTDRDTSTGRSPVTRLNNGVDMPVLGFGTYNAKGEQAIHVVRHALASGYRLVDTAAFYGNEQDVGAGIAASSVPRAELFVTTKLWFSEFSYDQALRAYDASLRRLGLDYVDLYLLHYPTPSNFDGTVDAYRALERLLAERRVRAIGVSNFKPKNLADLAARSQVRPAVNQIEIHPYFAQHESRQADRQMGIVTQSWSPIGGIFINHPRNPPQVVRLLEDPAIVRIAARHGRSPAQVVLRWHVQQGLTLNVKSVQPSRIEQNLRVFDFALSREDMAELAALERGLRGGRDPDTFDMKFMEERARNARAA